MFFIIVGLTAVVAILGRLFAAQVETIIAEMGMVVPYCSSVVLDTAPYWPLLPFVLLPLFLWSLRPTAPPRQPRSPLSLKEKIGLYLIVAFTTFSASVVASQLHYIIGNYRLHHRFTPERWTHAMTPFNEHLCF